MVDGNGQRIPLTDEKGNPIVEAATYYESPQHWIMLDADHMPEDCWRGLDIVTDAERIARRFRATLPPFLRDVKMLVQLSSSHGLPMIDDSGDIRPAVPKMHFWLLFDQALDDFGLHISG